MSGELPGLARARRSGCVRPGRAGGGPDAVCGPGATCSWASWLWPGRGSAAARGHGPLSARPARGIHTPVRAAGPAGGGRAGPRQGGGGGRSRHRAVRAGAERLAGRRAAPARRAGSPQTWSCTRRTRRLWSTRWGPVSRTQRRRWASACSPPARSVRWQHRDPAETCAGRRLRGPGAAVPALPRPARPATRDHVRRPEDVGRLRQAAEPADGAAAQVASRLVSGGASSHSGAWARAASPPRQERAATGPGRRSGLGGRAVSRQ